MKVRLGSHAGDGNLDILECMSKLKLSISLKSETKIQGEKTQKFEYRIR